MDIAQILTPLGFTSLEAEVYAYLLQNSPSTGYKVARSIGKATANTYKAIESLQSKGAVMVDEGANRLCRAVESDELLARLTRDFEWRRASAELELSRLTSKSKDDGIYALKSKAQVMERARFMLNEATHDILVVARADTAVQLRDSIKHSVDKGVKAFLLSDQSLDVRGLTQAKFRDGDLNELQIVVDAEQVLLALFGNSREDVQQSLWSQSAYLATVLYRSIVLRSEAKLASVEETASFKRLARTAH